MRVIKFKYTKYSLDRYDEWIFFNKNEMGMVYLTEFNTELLFSSNIYYKKFIENTIYRNKVYFICG